MTALGLIRRLFVHAAWADAELLRAVEALGPSLPPAALRELSHLLGADEVWLARLEARPARLAIWPQLALADLSPTARLLHASYERYLDTLGDDDLARPIRYTNSAGHTFDTAIGDILSHVALHAQYHRGKVNLLLRQAGFDPEPTDFIHYARGARAATEADVRR